MVLVGNLGKWTNLWDVFFLFFVFFVWGGLFVMKNHPPKKKTKGDGGLGGPLERC